jgi:hypothetical protein
MCPSKRFLYYLSVHTSSPFSVDAGVLAVQERGRLCRTISHSHANMKMETGWGKRSILNMRLPIAVNHLVRANTSLESSCSQVGHYHE